MTANYTGLYKTLWPRIVGLVVVGKKASYSLPAEGCNVRMI